MKCINYINKLKSFIKKVKLNVYLIFDFDEFYGNVIIVLDDSWNIIIFGFIKMVFFFL